jgi:hypothetical protein
MRMWLLFHEGGDEFVTSGVFTSPLLQVFEGWVARAAAGEGSDLKRRRLGIGIDFSRFRFHQTSACASGALSLLSPGLDACCRKRTYPELFQKAKEGLHNEKVNRLFGRLLSCFVRSGY